MERHLLQSGDLLDSLDVVGNDRVVGTEHWSEIANTLRPAGDALLVEVVAEQIDAVRVGNVVEVVAVHVGNGNTGGGFENGTGGQVFANMAAELERDPIDRGELQVGDSAADLGGRGTGAWEALAINRGEPRETTAPSAHDGVRRIVRAE